MTTLFIPGPTEVYPEVLEQMSRRMIGHRGAEYKKLQADVVAKLHKATYTAGRHKIFLFTSSATGVMEGAIRNLINKKSLHAVAGGFSKRWFQMAAANGKNCDKVEFEQGKHADPDAIESKLATGEYDAFFLTHCETDTGVLNPLPEFGKMMKKFPNVMFCVDAVSSFAGTKIDVDDLGIDCLLFGTQKALALPPGLAFGVISLKALEKTKEVPNRGYYFDFLAIEKSAEKDNTPVTPPVSQIFALDFQLDRILAEGMENRFERHQKMADLTINWANKYFDMFSEKGFHSPTVSTIKNTRNIDVSALNGELKKHNMQIANGYKDLKDLTFRIGHMGDHTPEIIEDLLGKMTEILKLK